MTVSVKEVNLQGGERIILTTDGVHGVLEEQRLSELVAKGDVQHVAAALVEAALASGSRDNATAVVADYQPG
jgi:PPM family protein phosphatase